MTNIADLKADTMWPVLDLAKRHFVHQRGDLTVYGTWFFDPDEGPRPCLALIPTHKQHWERCNPCVVTVDQAWVWSEEIGDGARCARIAFRFAQILELDVSTAFSVFRVMSVVREHIGDLCTIPPYAGEPIVVAEATYRDQSGKIRQAEIRQRV